MDDSSNVAWAAAAGGGVLTWLAQSVWNAFLSKPGRSYDQLVQQLSDRLNNQETRLNKFQLDLDEERRLRRIAEDKVHMLELDNMQLRATLQAHGIPLPPSMVNQTTITEDLTNVQDTSTGSTS